MRITFLIGIFSKIRVSRTGTTFVATDAFEYDGAGRLAGNARYVGQSLTSSYSEGGISYDRNGNMKTISRYGESGVTPVQNFSYVLAGNRVSRIAGNPDTYRYDSNGNVTHDPYRNRDISYNAIGRVSLVTDMEPAPVCRIGWTADGVKCSTVAENGSGLVYAGDMVFSRTSSGTLSFESMPFACGRIGDDLVPVFYATDHLGSTRAMIKGGNVVEEDDYYPYGGRRDIQSMEMLSTNRYRFSGKESLSGFGIDYMDFGARLYDPVICRWLSQDPLASSTPSFSPYSYCAGDPVNFVDPDGNSPIYSPEGVLLGTDDNGLQGGPIIMDKKNFTQGMTNADARKYDLGVQGLESEHAAMAFFLSYIQLSSRPDWDGYLTLEEANYWYNNGQGQPLFVSLEKIDLSGLVSLGEQYVDTERLINLFLASASLNDALVYGQIKLKRYPNHTVRAYSDKYDFDMKPWLNLQNCGRNIETIIGKIVAGGGTPYEINIYGSKTLQHILP